jgi:hypothetical protein
MAQGGETPAQFAAACQHSVDYPLTVLRTEAFGHTQISLQKRFREKNCFHPSFRSLFVLDLLESSAAFDELRGLENVDEVESHLVPEDMDPWVRFM